MEQQNNPMEELKKSVYQLMNKYAVLDAEKKELEEQNSILKKEIEEQQSEIEDLKNKYKVLKMAKSLEGSSNENKEVKLKINEMVREIDKCIALLNK